MINGVIMWLCMLAVMKGRGGGGEEEWGGAGAGESSG